MPKALLRCLFPFSPGLVTLSSRLRAPSAAFSPCAWSATMPASLAAAAPSLHRRPTILPQPWRLWRSLCPAGILEQADDRIVIVHSVIAELREALR